MDILHKIHIIHDPTYIILTWIQMLGSRRALSATY